MTGQIIAEGTTAFTPIVDKLGAITTEFLPYMIYVSIACLGVALAFKALKYILGYLQGKAKGTIEREGMKERRRRRRKNRRFVRSVKNHTYKF